MAPSILILPKQRSVNGRICTFIHPRTANPSRYFVDPISGIFEFTSIRARKSACSSWLLSPSIGATESDSAGKSPISDGYVLQKPELLVATPLDPLFLLLPAFSFQKATDSGCQQLFLSFEDLTEKLFDDASDFEAISGDETLNRLMESRTQAICDTVDAGEQKMYRLSMEKLLRELLAKAIKLAQKSLPRSMEQKFVQQALEVPYTGELNEESQDTVPPGDRAKTPMSAENSVDSQTSTATASSIDSETSNTTDLTIPDTNTAEQKPDIQHLLRLKTVLDYMIMSYIPSSIAHRLLNMLVSDECSFDFKKLQSHLAELEKLRAQALASRSVEDFSLKRSAHDEEDLEASRAEKRRKKEEEEKKKKMESRGVKDLKKVNTAGMKKMSDFFGKGLASKKR